MAQNYKYNKVTNEKFAIKGELSEDGKVITYINGDNEEAKITVDKCFAKFAGFPIDFSISLKTEIDLSDEFEEYEEE